MKIASKLEINDFNKSILSRFKSIANILENHDRRITDDIQILKLLTQCVQDLGSITNIVIESE